MVIPARHESWAIRLARLQRLIDDQVEGPAWLWTIRVRILSYLVSRYRACEARAARGADAAQTNSVRRKGLADEPYLTGQFLEVEVGNDAAPIELHHPLLPIVGADHPPKSTVQLSAILENIRLINYGLRGTSYDAAWLWWRQGWCVRS
jgi:hypothetical protein